MFIHPPETPFSVRLRPWLLSGLLLAFALLLLGLFLTPVGDPDVYIHLRDGKRWMESHGQLPADDFSYTLQHRTLERVEVSFRILLYQLWKWQGYTALIIFKTLLLFLATGLLMLASWQRWQRLELILLALGLTLVWNTLALHSLESYLHIRPYLITYMGLPLTLMLLEHLARSQTDAGWLKFQPAWLIPIYTCLWANLHPGFVVVFILIFAYGLEEGLRYWRDPAPAGRKKILLLLVLAAATFAAGALNPLGFGIYSFVINSTQNHDYMRIITEWQPAAFSKVPHFYIYLGLLGLLLLSNLQSPRWSNWIIAAGFGWLGLASFRQVVPAYFATLPILLDELRKCLARFSPITLPKPFYPATVGLFTLVLLGLTWQGTTNQSMYQPGVMREHLPGRALAWLETAKIGGRIFAPFGWGGFIGWATDNHYKIFMDGRVDHFGPGLFREDVAIEYGTPQCLADLAKHSIDIILVRPQGPIGVYQAIIPTGQWALVYFDEACEIFLLRTDQHKKAIETYEYHYVDPLKNPFFDTQHPTESLLELNRAIATAPDAYVPLYLKASLLLAANQTQPALQEFAEVKKLNPHHLGTLYSLGIFFLNSAQYDLAKDHFEQMLRHTDDPSLQAQVFLNMSVLFQRQQQYGAALAWAQRALPHHPDPAQVKEFIRQLENPQGTAAAVPAR